MEKAERGKPSSVVSEKRVWPGWGLKALLTWLVPKLGCLNPSEDRGHQCEPCGCFQGRQRLHGSSTCQSLCDRGRFKCVAAAPNHFVSFVQQEGQVRAASGGTWDLHLPTPTWQMVLTGSPAPLPSLQWASKTYSSLNWESVTYLNCFFFPPDLIRIFHL